MPIETVSAIRRHVGAAIIGTAFLFCLALVGGFLALAAHPLLTYPLSLLLVGKGPPVVVRPADAPRPTLAICMCAYRERDVIAAKIERLIEMMEAYGPATVHVYIDAADDGTAAIAQRYADRIDLVVGTERAGKTYGMNLLVARSTSELLLFTDANVESGADVAIILTAPLADPSVGGATAKLVYSNGQESPTSKLGSLYWALEEWIKRIESSRTGLIGCDGALFVMRRSLHVAPPPFLIDDLYLSLRILLAGSRIVSVDQVEVFERSATGADEEKARKQRIACQAINVHRVLWRDLRRMPLPRLYGYLSHRPIKWLMPFFVAGAAVSAFAALAVAAGPMIAMLALALLIVVLVVGEKRQVRPVSLVSSALLSLFGVGIGVVESIFFKKTYTVWHPAMSVRREREPGKDARRLTDELDGPPAKGRW